MIKTVDISVISVVFFFIILVYCAYTDFRYGKIYNWVTYPSFLIGLFFNYVLYGKTGLYSGLIGAAAGGIIFFAFYFISGLGAGDVKLMMVIGAFGGFKFVLWTLYYSSIVGFFVGIVLLTANGLLKEGLRRSVLYIKGMFLPSNKKIGLGNTAKIKVPYGMIVVVGGYLAFFLKGLV